MKKIFFLILASTFFFSCKKETATPAPVPANSPTYFSFAGQLSSNNNSTVVSTDDQLVLCGSLNNDITIMKISKTGMLTWRNDFFANGYISGIAEAGNQELFACGVTARNYAGSNNDILLVKTNSSGDTLWTKTYGGANADYGTNIIATSDGNLLILGKTESFGAGPFGDLYLIKLNTNGDTIWTNTFPDPDQEVPFNLMETQNGEFLLTGTNEDNSNPREAYLVKVSATGSQIWNQKIGPATWKWGFSTIELSNGDLLTSGKHSSTDGYTQILIIKTDHLGNVIWEREYGNNTLSENGNSIKENADGTFTVAGESYDATTGLYSSVLLKIDQNGNQLYLNYFGNSAGNGAKAIIKDANGDNIITGNYSGNIFMTRTDNNGVYN
jgi:hypothetical protein